MGFTSEQFVQSVDDNLICCICCGVVHAPVSGCRQGHIFCRTCILTWMASQTARQAVPLPYRRDPNDESKRILRTDILVGTCPLDRSLMSSDRLVEVKAVE